MRLLTIIVSLIGISGCTSTVDKSSDTVKIGKDTYQLSDTIYSWNQNELMMSANKYCALQNKEILLTSKETIEKEGTSLASYTLTFLCLKEDDPRYTEANPQTKADIIIEKKITK
jgi:hypothetical protein